MEQNTLKEIHTIKEILGGHNEKEFHYLDKLIYIQRYSRLSDKVYVRFLESDKGRFYYARLWHTLGDLLEKDKNFFAVKAYGITVVSRRYGAFYGAYYGEELIKKVDDSLSSKSKEDFLLESARDYYLEYLKNLEEIPEKEKKEFIKEDLRLGFSDNEEVARRELII